MGLRDRRSGRMEPDGRCVCAPANVWRQPLLPEGSTRQCRMEPTEQESLKGQVCSRLSLLSDQCFSTLAWRRRWRGGVNLSPPPPDRTPFHRNPTPKYVELWLETEKMSYIQGDHWQNLSSWRNPTRLCSVEQYILSHLVDTYADTLWALTRLVQALARPTSSIPAPTITLEDTKATGPPAPF